MIVIGCDPGLARFGIAIVGLGTITEKVLAVDVYRTAPTPRKRGVLAADDNVRRVRELGQRLLGLIGERRPVAFCAESMSAPRSASSAAKLAMSWGVLGTVAEVAGLPIVQASPQRIKSVVTGNASASKVDVQTALIQRFGEPDLFAGLRAGDVEHAADAVAAMVACLDFDVIRMARRLAA